MGSAKGAVEAFGSFFPDIGEETSKQLFHFLGFNWRTSSSSSVPVATQHAEMSHARALSLSIVWLNRINEHLSTI